jgi:polar amino acid transport system substrate-binding protein
MTAYDWLGMLGALTSGQADVAFSGISIADKRKEIMDFSNPYFTSTWQLIRLKNRHIKITDLSQLKNTLLTFPSFFTCNQRESSCYQHLLSFR